MAQNLTVKPAYLNNTQVMIDGVLTLLTNNLTQAQLLAIWQKPEYNSFIAIEYVNVQDSFPENFQIDPNLFNAYDSGQISHDKTKTNYPANTTGAALNEARGVIDNVTTQIQRPSVLPIHNYNFARAKKIPTSCYFQRNSTASYIDKYGVIKYAKINQPRFTHDPITRECLGYLSEESRTNYVLSSNVFSEYSTFINKVVNQPSPDGLLNATLLSKKALDNSYFVSTSDALANGFFVRSIFVKQANTIESIIAFEGVGVESASGGTVTFNILTKTFNGNINALVNYGYLDYSNGWLRVWMVIEKSDTKIVKTKYFIGGYGNQSANDNSMYVFGSMIEEGKCLTSYIPTNGAIATRAFELLAIRNSEFPKGQHSILASGVIRGTWEKNQFGYNRVVAHYLASYISYSINGTLSAFDGANSTSQTSIAPENCNVAYSANMYRRRLCLNGGNIITANSNSDVVISGANSADVYIGCGTSNGNNNLNGTIKRIAIYATELTDSEMKTLTNNTNNVRDTNDGISSNSGMNDLAFWTQNMLVQTLSRQEFSIDGTGASITRNIRRPYDFYFELVDTTGYTALTSQPPATLCSANTDYPLTVTLPVGKTLTYAIVPNFEN